MKSVVIAGYARTPFTLAKKGALAQIRPDDLATAAIQGVLAQTGVDGKEIEDLILGCAFPEGEQGLNMARLVVLLAGLPQSMGGVTVNRFCGSSMQAIHQAAGAIQMNAGHAFLCAGVESMTRIPMGGYNPSPNPALYARMPQAYIGMGQTAENLARQYGVTRQEQEAFAVASHHKAAVAQAAGKFQDEIVAVNGISTDGAIRPETTPEILAGLKLAFDESGTVTAGTASP